MLNILGKFKPVRNAIYLAALLTIIACSEITPTISNDVLVKLERSGCLGDCPVYSLEIKKNGDVTFEGIEYVKALGIHKSSISKDAVLSIESALTKAKFTTMQSDLHPVGWGCFVAATDHSYMVIQATIKNKTKAVSTYTGCDAKQVSAAIKLADEIDRIAEAAKWIEGLTP